VNEEDFVLFIGDDMLMKHLHYVRKTGNCAAHGMPVTRKQAYFALIDIYHFVGDLLMKLGVIDDYPQFDEYLIPLKPPIHIAPDVEAVPAPAPTDKYEGKLDTQLVTKPVMEISEADTRKLFIDMMLHESGWQVVEEENSIQPSKACIEVEVDGMPNAAGVGYADYVLFGADGKPLAVIEAKKTSVDALKGRNQAKLYAECLEQRYGVKPVIYYTNGYTTYIIDRLGYPARKVFSFMTEDDLLLTVQKQGRSNITDMRISDEITNREYQKRAIKFVCERFNNKKRRALIVMATGTGKTRVAISLVELLQRNNWIKNVLFLADRISLVKQAHKNFVKLLPHNNTCILSEDKDPDMNARIMFSTYQTMINYIDQEEKTLPVGRFDLIIIDEAHRSVFGKYGAIFEYFDSLLVGLTATPREDIDKNTFDLLEMDADDGNNFYYELEEAVKDHFLVNYKTFARHTDVMASGIRYKDLSAEEKQQMEKVWEYEKARKALDDNTDYCRDIDKGEIFNYLFNTKTVDLVLQDLMQKGLRVDEGERIGKTIIFAYNHAHAQLIVERFAKLYPEYGDDFCQLIDTYETYSQNLLEKFEVGSGLPQIAVSVDMLDTGVDVPEVLNLVFFKVVRSKIKFIQMIGRGTRLCNDIFGPGRDKECFYIFDYLNNFEYFDKHGEEVPSSSVQSLTERLFDVRLDIAVALQAAQYQAIPEMKLLHDELKESLRQEVEKLRDSIISVRMKWEIVTAYKKKDNWEYVSEVDALKIKSDIAPLLVQEMGDVSAKKFDLIVALIELSLLVEGVNADACKQKVVFIAQALEKKASVPAVMCRMKTIREVQTEGFWKQADMPNMERVRKEMRDLVHLLETQAAETFIVDINDKLTDDGVSVGIPIVMSYRQRVVDYIARNKDRNRVLLKIANIVPLTHEDMMELQRILWQDLGTKDEYDHNATNIWVRSNVAAFVRSIMGVNREKALELFTTLISNTNLNSLQESFLKTIIKYVCENGDITRENLQDEPFITYLTNGVFDDKIDKLADYVDCLHGVISGSSNTAYLGNPQFMAAEEDPEHPYSNRKKMG
jgi:type I restriction enzyme R subunit